MPKNSAWLRSLLDIGGTPEKNPEAQTGPNGDSLPMMGDVKGPDTDVLPYVQPSWWQRVTNPTYAQRVDALNTQYQNTPIAAAQQFDIAKRQAADIARTAIQYHTGKAPSDDEVKGAVAAYGTRIVGSGLSPGEYNMGEEQRGEVQRGLPAIRATTAGVEASNRYESAKAQAEMGTPRRQVEAENEQLINDIARFTKVDRVNVQRAAIDAERAWGRAPTENDILDQLASNRLYLERNVAPLENLTAERRADTAFQMVPDWQRAQVAKTAQEAAMAEHVGRFNPASPYEYNYNPGGNPNNPMYPFGSKTRNPTYSPQMMNAYMGSQMMQQQMGQGGGFGSGGAMQLPNGSFIVPSTGVPQSPMGQQQPVRQPTVQPTFNTARPLSFSNQPTSDADMQKQFAISQAVRKVRAGIKLSPEEFSSFTPDEYHNILQQGLQPQQ